MLLQILIWIKSSKEKHTALNIIRLGTAGAVQPDIPVDSFIMSSYGLGLDGLLNFYADKGSVFENELTEAFINQTNYPQILAKPYIVKCSEKLAEKLGKGITKGITATASGFYGPQGRELKLKLAYPDLNKKSKDLIIKMKGLQISKWKLLLFTVWANC